MALLTLYQRPIILRYTYVGLWLIFYRVICARETFYVLVLESLSPFNPSRGRQSPKRNNQSVKLLHEISPSSPILTNMMQVQISTAL